MSECPAKPSPLIGRHREVLVIACVVWVLAFLLVEVPGGRVAVRGFSQFPLPETCTSRTWLGVKCPGCGLTRSIVHMAEGDWRASWHAHRLGFLMGVVIAFQVPYRLLSLRRPEHPLIAPRVQAILGYALIALLFANWLVEAVAGRVIAR
jgi:Protein of unknown function (DUF2752)